MNARCRRYLGYVIFVVLLSVFKPGFADFTTNPEISFIPIPEDSKKKSVSIIKQLSQKNIPRRHYLPDFTCNKTIPILSIRQPPLNFKFRSLLMCVLWSMIFSDNMSKHSWIRNSERVFIRWHGRTQNKPAERFAAESISARYLQAIIPKQ